MLKWLVLLLLQKNILLHAVIIGENIREPRQLDFDNCCPCAGTGRTSVDDQDGIETPIGIISPHDNCPCQTSSDSESASSIFRPTLKAVEPFVKQADQKGQKVDPKPLLNPEVGLASSVLETLREATEEEYREAVLRDTARNTINALEESPNTPRDLFNIILQPKDDNIDDVIPQASNIQSTHYIYPPLSTTNNLEEIKAHPIKLLRESLPLRKLANDVFFHKKLVDMGNGANNIQENSLRPVKTYLFEDLKLTSDFLKSKLFQTTRNSLRDTQPIFNIKYGNDNGQDCEHIAQTSNLKIPYLLDQFKKSKEIMSANAKQSITKSKSPVSKAKSEFVSYADNTKTNILLNGPKSAENIDIVNEGNQQNSDFTNTYDENNDAYLSPSEIIETKPLETVSKPEHMVEDECIFHNEEIVEDNTNDIGNDAKQTMTEERIPSLVKEFPDNDYIDQTKPKESVLNASVNEDNLSNEKDSEVGASRNSFQITGAPENLSNVSEPRNDEAEKFISDNTRKVDIKNNILKKIENLKRANGRIQELKSNVQNSLQFHTSKNIGITERDSIPLTTSIPENNVCENYISTQDLQDMSDQILSLSSLKKASDTSTLPNLTENSLKNTEQLNNNGDESSNDAILSTNILSDIYKSTSRGSSEEIPENLQSNDDRTINTNPINNSCDHLLNTSLANGKTNIDSSNTEMLSQASNPIVSSIQRPAIGGFVVQPNSNLHVNEFLGNLKSSVSDMFNNKKGSNLFYDANNDPTTNLRVSEDMQASRDPLSKLNEYKNVGMGKSYTRSHNASPKLKINTPNIDSYKAKVAVPESLSIKKSAISPNEKVGTLKKSYDAIPMSSVLDVLKNSVNKPSPLNMNKMIRNNNKRGEVVGQKFNKLHNIAPPVFTENLQTRTENALKNIQEAFSGNLRQPLITHRNGILSNTNSKNIFRPILKPNDELSEKLRSLHLDLNDKLSSLSQRILDISGKPLQSQNILNYPIKTKETGKLKSDSKYKGIQFNKPIGDRTDIVTQNTPSIVKSVQNGLSSIRREGISKPNKIQNKSPLKQATLDSTKSVTITRPSILKKEPAKTHLKTAIKFKPFKDRKVTINISTTPRPDILKSGLKSIPRSPAPLLKSPLENKQELRLNIKPGDSKTLPSERNTFRVPFSTKSLYTSEESLNKKNVDTDNIKNSNNIKELIPDGRTKNNSVLSKIRDAVKARVNGNVSKNIDGNILNSNSLSDASQSASNIDTVSTQERPLKENVSYKCKMSCIQDNFD